MYSAQYTVNIIQCSVYMVLVYSIVCSVKCTLGILGCTVYGVRFIVYGIRYIVFHVCGLGLRFISREHTILGLYMSAVFG